MNKYIWQVSLNKEIVSSAPLENLLWMGTSEVIHFFICHPAEFSDMIHAERRSIQYN